MQRVSTSSVQTGEGLFAQFLDFLPTGSTTYRTAASYILTSISRPRVQTILFLNLLNGEITPIRDSIQMPRRRTSTGHVFFRKLTVRFLVFNIKTAKCRIFRHLTKIAISDTMLAPNGILFEIFNGSLCSSCTH